MKTFVYIIQAGENGPVKVGKADDVAKRLINHQCSNHERLTVLVAVPAAPKHERTLHRLLAGQSIRGEWFRWNSFTQLLVSMLQKNGDVEDGIKALKLANQIFDEARTVAILASNVRRYRRERNDAALSDVYRNFASERIVDLRRQSRRAGLLGRTAYARHRKDRTRRLIAEAQGAVS